MKKDCEPLTPSFKVRILITSEASNKVLNACVQVLIPLPRENRHPHGCLFFSSIEEDKDSKNRYYEAKPSNKVLNACVQVLIPLPLPRDIRVPRFFMPEYCFLRWYSGIFPLLQNIVRVFERF